MPGRASTRSSRGPRGSNAVSHKSSTASLNPRASTASRGSSASVFLDIPPEAPDNALRHRVAAVFRDAQRTTASHRKLVVSLRKLQETCCYEPASGGGGGSSGNKAKAVTEDFDEKDFNTEMARCVLRVMPVKKSEGVGERAIRFIGLFLRHTVDKDNELLGEDEDAADTSTMPETPATRLIAHLVETVLPLLMAKDKFVRYRSTQLVAHMVNSLDAIDDDIFRKIRAGLLRRIRDKEAMVRCQAVLGLGRLAGNQVEAAAAAAAAAGGADENDSSDEDGASANGLLMKLLDVLQNDPSTDVRRSLLVNLPILPSTLPWLLERARDQDALTRRAVYSRLLPALGDFRHLSLSMREKLLRWGLRDRDETVRNAAGRVFRERWIEDCATSNNPEGGDDADREQPQQPAPPSIDGLLELLERIDVVNSAAENGVALEAMQGFWEGRPDYREAVVFDDGFWETLSAESVFLVRSFNHFCRKEGGGKYEALIEEKLPEVTKVAFYLERYIKVLIDAIKRLESKEQQEIRGDEEDEDEEKDEEDTAEQEFIVEQLLHIALTLDYSDEVGRRKMYSLLRQTLCIPELPDEVTKLTVDVLRDICAPDAAGEKEFCSIVLEAVADVHDTIAEDLPEENGESSMDGDEESFHSAQSEIGGDGSDSTPTKKKTGPGAHKKARASGSLAQSDDVEEEDEKEATRKAIKEIMINMKCLHIVQCMLANVAGKLDKNDHLVSMLNNLVVPAVRSHEAPVRERGLVCLGLCSLLDRPLAEENLRLFMHFFAKGHTALQVTALHILTDILNVHGAQLLTVNPALLKVYIKALRPGSSRSPEVQATATTAVCKLLLGRVIGDASADADVAGGTGTDESADVTADGNRYTNSSAMASELLRTLVVTYFKPTSNGNQAVRQALNYFLPVYAFSRPENQERVRAVALDCLHALYNVREGLSYDSDMDGGPDGDASDAAFVDPDEAGDMVSLAAVGACLVDWTDPRKCYGAGDRLLQDGGAAAGSTTAKSGGISGDVHLDFAMDILERLETVNKEERKVIAPLLGKLYISPASSEAKIREAYAAVGEAVEGGLLTDASGRNALYKIHVSLGKIVHNLDATAGEAERDRGFGASAMSMRRSVVGGSRRSSSMGVDERAGTATEDKSTIMLAPSEAKIKEEEEEGDGDGDGENGEDGEEDDATVVGVGWKGQRDSFADESVAL